jgi:hypothetical protein
MSLKICYLAALAIGLGWSLPHSALADAANGERLARQW